MKTPNFLPIAFCIQLLAACSSSEKVSVSDSGSPPAGDASGDAEHGDSAVVPDAGATLLWYRGCGDPVCGRDAGGGTCTTETVGAPCTAGSSACNTGDSCNTPLICSATDPTQSPFGCPVSERSRKQAISRLSTEERRSISQAVLDLPMSTYVYREHANAGRRLGFMLDESPTSYPIAADGKHVDVYGFASMAVVTIQEQAARIDSLERRIRELETRAIKKTK